MVGGGPLTPGSRSAPTEPRLPWAVTSGPCRSQGTNTPVRYHIRSVQRNSTTHNRKPNPGKAPSGATRYSPGQTSPLGRVQPGVRPQGRTKPGVRHTPKSGAPAGRHKKAPSGATRYSPGQTSPLGRVQPGVRPQGRTKPGVSPQKTISCFPVFSNASSIWFSLF